MTMKTWLGTSAAITMGLAVGLVAQSPKDDAAKHITVTGCIQRATPSPTGTTGTAGTSGMATKFVLSSATMSTTGTSGRTEPSATAASQYRLDADDAKLTPHVGHKVEIAGTVEEATSAMPNPPPAAGSPAANEPKLKVDTVKMISSTCP
jgi:hypothetical protein